MHIICSVNDIADLSVVWLFLVRDVTIVVVVFVDDRFAHGLAARRYRDVVVVFVVERLAHSLSAKQNRRNIDRLTDYHAHHLAYYYAHHLAHYVEMTIKERW